MDVVAVVTTISILTPPITLALVRLARALSAQSHTDITSKAALATAKEAKIIALRAEASNSSAVQSAVRSATGNADEMMRQSLRDALTRFQRDTEQFKAALRDELTRTSVSGTISPGVINELYKQNEELRAYVAQWGNYLKNEMEKNKKEVHEEIKDLEDRVENMRDEQLRTVGHLEGSGTLTSNPPRRSPRR